MCSEMQSLMAQELQSKECDAIGRCKIGQYQDYQRFNNPLFSAVNLNFVVNFCSFCKTAPSFIETISCQMNVAKREAILFLFGCSEARLHPLLCKRRKKIFQLKEFIAKNKDLILFYVTQREIQIFRGWGGGGGLGGRRF